MLQLAAVVVVVKLFQFDYICRMENMRCKEFECKTYVVEYPFYKYSTDGSHETFFETSEYYNLEYAVDHRDMINEQILLTGLGGEVKIFEHHTISREINI